MCFITKILQDIFREEDSTIFIKFFKSEPQEMFYQKKKYQTAKEQDLGQTNF